MADPAITFNWRFLKELADAPPSRDRLQRLVGPTATTIKFLGEEAAFAYVLAAAKQLTVVFTDHTDSAAMLAPVGQLSLSNQIEEVLVTVGNCVAKCSSPEQIVQSNIIPVLHNIQKSKYVISLVHSEFLQACIYAKQYSFAETQVQDTWPKPRKGIDSDSHLILRYFYLRGMVHMGTCNWSWAVRCFTTCACIPAESSAVSAIAIAAWKKLVLVACLQTDFHTPNLLLPLFPKHMTSKLKQFIEDASRSHFSAVNACPESTSVVVVEESTERPENPSLAASQSNKYGVTFYKDIASAFEKRDRLAFISITKQASSLFDSDGTAGLVQRVDEVLLRRQLYKIGSMFATISVPDLKTQLCMTEEPQDMLQRLEEEKAWPIRVEDGWVYFPSDIPNQPSQETIAQTQRDMIVLRSHLAKLHKETAPKVPRKADPMDQNRREPQSMLGDV